MKHLIFLPLLLIFSFFSVSVDVGAQELRCRVSVVSSKIQRTDRQVFESLQSDLFEFMNNRIWTNHVFSTEERIECAVMINLEEQLSQNEWKGTMQIQASRPVFNSSYKSVLLNYKDNDIQFSYFQGESLEFSLSQHSSNLSSLMAFYAYIILGFDYDSYAPEGGTEFFQNAETIVSNAQSAKEKGWKSFESSDRKNRYWLVNNILDDKYDKIRKFYYQYHRQGLDKMADDVNKGRSNVLEAIKLLQEVNRRKPDPFMHYLKIVVDAKSDEIINIFKGGSPDEQSRVIRIMSEIDPANSSEYEIIKKQR